MENLAPMLPLFGALSALAAVVWLLLLLTRAVDIKRIRQVVVMISTPFVDWLLRRLTMVANAKRIRQLVVKDNDIADDEKRGLSIESVSCVVAHWRDDTIEFKPSFVLRNRWIDSWNILEYKGDFSITDFATTYRLEPALSTPPLHPLSAASARETNRLLCRLRDGFHRSSLLIRVQARQHSVSSPMKPGDNHA